MKVEPLQFVPYIEAGAGPDPTVAKSQTFPSPAEQKSPPEQGPQSSANSPGPQEVRQHTVSIKIDSDKRVYYQVIDERTGEVVDQFPPEELMRFSRSLGEYLRSKQTGADHRLNLLS